jgi:hypothetical protein
MGALAIFASRSSAANLSRILDAENKIQELTPNHCLVAWVEVRVVSEVLGQDRSQTYLPIIGAVWTALTLRI